MKYIYIAFMFLSITSVYAYDVEYYINDTQLPYQTTFTGLVYGGVNGEEVTVEYGGNFTSGLTSFTFEDPTYPLVVNILLNKTGSFSDYVKVTNTVTNFSNVTTFYAVVYNSSLPVQNQSNQTNTTTNVTDVNRTNIIQIDFNDFEYNLCDYTLPFNSTKAIIVDGYMNQTIYVDYDLNGFIRLNTSYVMPPENFTSITARIFVPENTSIGKYIQTVRFSVLSNFSNVTFRFNINDCILPPPDVYERFERCREAIDTGGGNLTPEEFLQCIGDMASYFSDYYDALAETQKELLRENKSRVIYVNETVYEPVLELKDKDLITALKDLPTKLNQMITENRNKELKIAEIQTQLDSVTLEKTELENTLDQRITDRLQVLIEDSVNKSAEIQMYKEEYIEKKRITYSVVGLIIVAGFVGLLLYYQYDSIY